ncbi:MAG: DUF4445 domain-containing protein [Oscillospiraceae bacterium]|nr:DUF4445 domain-containing protein [Oscillospiraceae bacterium]
MEYISKNERMHVLPVKETVLSAMGCVSGGPLYDSILAEFDTLYERVKAALDVRCTIAAEESRIYVLITAGAQISELSDELFSVGEGLAGLIVNNCADDVLLEADKLCSERIKYYCAGKDLGISKRLDAPLDIPVSEQAVIVNNAPVEGVTITDAFMLNPVKSMGYELELTDDRSVFNAQHDCSKCPNTSCSRRSVSGAQFDIISDFDYNVSSANGVAIDIGTTTIAVMRFKNGKAAARKTELNAQRRFGADVLSRIDAANRGRGAELRSVVEYQIRKMINNVGGVGLPAVIAANTAMTSLYMGWDCTGLGKYPFKAHCLDTVQKDNITVTGGISAFVGGDITSGLYMCGFDESDEINLFVDLGTNGEMAIGNRHQILCTSTAAGPAFEGGRISCGTGAVEGAICSVDLKNNRFETIGNKLPCGICGSGITELVSELLDNGYCDSTGRFKERYSGGITLAEGVVFTQQDMREFQTAKAAVRAGIELLITEYGAEEQDIKHVYIAGGFGKRLNIEKACRIGLLPQRLRGRYRAVGNSSLGGAAKLLENIGGFCAIDRLKAASKDFSLAENPGFSDEFMKYMNF